jgi:hypothetical protein
MTLQILALLIWWPKQSLADTLAQPGTPSTLLAVLYAVGITATFTAVRDAGGEFELEQARRQSTPDVTMAVPAQLSWSELWPLFTRCALWILMSLPLLLAAASVSAATLGNLALNLAALYTLCVLAVVSARLSWQILWRRETLHYLMLRFGWLACLALPALIVPDASYVMVSYLQFSDSGAQALMRHSSLAGIPTMMAWQGVCGVIAVACTVALNRTEHAPKQR